MPLKQVEMDATGLTCKVALGKRRNQSLEPREGLSGSTMESKSKEESRSQQRQGCATIQGVLLKHPIMTGSAQLWLDSITDPMDMKYEQTQGDSGGQRTLACCSPWGHRELDTTYD